MQLTEVHVTLCPPAGGRLKAFCSLIFDNALVVRDVKLIEGNDGLFVAMPSRKLCDRCRTCGEKNHLRARFCNNCGQRLDENRHARSPFARRDERPSGRPKLHADIAHPINAVTRKQLERQVLSAYEDEVARSHEPGYEPRPFDDDWPDSFDFAASGVGGRFRPTGTDSH